MEQTLADLMAERFGQPNEAGSAMAAEGPLAAILGRRTHRRYNGRPVPEGLMQVLLACAQSAPSKSDLQQYSVVVVKDSASRGKLAALLPGMPWIARAPEFLVFLGDMRRNQRICELRGRTHVNNSLDTFFNASVDAALAMQSFILAAESAGLGCCAISHLRNHMATVCEVLALPPGVFPIAGLCVGWPAEEGRISMRLPPALVVHRDRYGEEDLEEELDRYDRRRHEQAPLGPENQKNAAAYGTSPVCTWSDNVSRQLSLPEREDFSDFLKGHGFDLI